jgi:hypothetical protein
MVSGLFGMTFTSGAPKARHPQHRHFDQGEYNSPCREILPLHK